MNEIRFRIILALVILSSLVACTKTETENTFEFGEIFDLKFEEQKTSSDGEVSVLFAELVNDTRCPQNVDCFISGEVELILSVSNGGNDPVDLQLLARNMSLDGWFTRDTVNNYIYLLKEVLPHRESYQSFYEPRDFSLKLQVEQL